MATITGQRTTTGILSDQLAIDLGDRISLLEPDSQPLTVFSRAAGKARTVATKFSWLEDSSEARFDAINNGAGYADNATSIVVDNGAYFAEHDLVLITRTTEMVRVTAVATNTLTVVRGVGSTAAAILDNDELYILGSAQPEGDTSKPARSSNPSKQTNYRQIFRDPFQSSRSLLASGFQVNPNDWAHQSKKSAIEHAKSIELNLLLGRKSLDTSGSTERRTTGGLLSFITTNQTDAGGTFTEAEFNTAMRQAGRYMRGRRLALASSAAVSALNSFPAAKQQVMGSSDKTYGLNVTNYQSPFGSLNLVYHPLLEGTKYGGYLVGVDLDEVTYRYLANDEYNRDTKVIPNIQANDLDGRKDEIKTECGLQVGQQKRHFVVTGIVA